MAFNPEGVGAALLVVATVLVVAVAEGVFVLPPSAAVPVAETVSLAPDEGTEVRVPVLVATVVGETEEVA